MKIIQIFLCVLCGLLSSYSLAYNWSVNPGNGTADNPYQITTVEELLAIGNDSHYGHNFCLMNDLDLSGHSYSKALICSSSLFNGTFDGNNKVITGLTISGSSNLGLFGLLGYNGSIKNLGMEDVNIYVSGATAGGVVASNRGGTVERVYVTGTISGGNHCGGISGNNRKGIIENSYSHCTVNGFDYIGGAVGSNYGSLKNVYSTGSVIAAGTIFGGLVGYGGGSITAGFWDVEQAGILISPGGRGLNTEDMMDVMTYQYNSWADGIWSIDSGSSYPYFSWQELPGEIIGNPDFSDILQGDGSDTSPFIIDSAADIQLVCQGVYFSDKHMLLDADIDLEGSELRPIAYNNEIDGYAGVFNGNGHIIQNVEIVGKNYIGLFSSIGNGGHVFDLGVKNISVSSDGNFVGGIAGQIKTGGLLETSFVTGTIFGNDYVGGIVGNIFNDGKVLNCYCECDVTGEKIIGGAVGGISYSGFIGYSYSTGSVFAASDVSVGGFVGSANHDGVTACFWDTQTSEIDLVFRGIGLTTAQMQQYSTFSTNYWTDGKWTIDSDIDYPRLAWENKSDVVITEPGSELLLPGNGTEENPFVIDSVSDLQKAGASIFYFDKHIVLANNLDLSGKKFYMLGANNADGFTGTFDGKQYTISNMLITGDTNVGLFSYIGNNAYVHDLIIDAVDISASGYFVGTLAGQCKYAEIERVSAKGTVNGKYYVGGLIGSCTNSNIVNSFAVCDVTGISDYLGGLIGLSNNIDIKNCYSQGTVTGDSSSNFVGGLVGKIINSTVSTSYSACSFTGTDPGRLVGGGYNYNSVFEECFWDIEMSGSSNAFGYAGLTTEQMQNILFFKYSTWGNGDWVMANGLSYPHLAWEDTELPLIDNSDVVFAGSGIVGDPYIISDSDDLFLVSLGSYFLDKHLKQAADIDMGDYEFYSFGSLHGGSFTGSYNGAGHTIKNVNFVQGEITCLGIFNEVGIGGIVKNLEIDTLDFTETYSNRLGCVAGRNNGTISNVAVDKIMSPSNLFFNAGAIAGENWGLISGCTNNSELNIYGDSIGGLVGSNYSTGVIDISKNSGVLNIGNSYTAGGIAGENSGTIVRCSNVASVNGQSQHLGGIVGINNLEGIIELSCNTADLLSYGDYIGGVSSVNYGAISDCYSICSISREYMLEWYMSGGFSAINNGNISNSYCIAELSDTSAAGFVASSSNYHDNIINCYYLSSPEISDNYAIALTDQQLRQKNSFAGLDFIGDNSDGNNDYWRLCVDDLHYPKLNWEHMVSGDFTCTDGVNIEDLMALSEIWLLNVEDDSYGSDFDINRDGIINLIEAGILSKHWAE